LGEIKETSTASAKSAEVFCFNYVILLEVNGGFAARPMHLMGYNVFCAESAQELGA
jgi:hypothetical protein